MRNSESARHADHPAQYDASMDWSEYVTRGIAGRNQEDVALLVNVSQSSISRWASGGKRPSAENVMAFSRAVGDSPIVGLLAAGYLREDEAGEVVRVATDLGDAAAEALLIELGRRLGIHASVRKERAG